MSYILGKETTNKQSYNDLWKTYARKIKDSDNLHNYSVMLEPWGHD